MLYKKLRKQFCVKPKKIKKIKPIGKYTKLIIWIFKLLFLLLWFKDNTSMLIKHMIMNVIKMLLNPEK